MNPTHDDGAPVTVATPDADSVDPRCLTLQEVAAEDQRNTNAWDPFHADEHPAKLGRFTVLEPIGHGAMGSVLAAYDDELDRKVAIKIMVDGHGANTAHRIRFEREAQALARLSHPNVVPVYEVGEADGRLFLAMELIRGQSLDVWAKSEHDWSTVLDVYVQAGRGLAAAHRAGLVHRDLKPHNIMRGEDGAVKVLDFGLVRLVDAHEPSIGTTTDDASSTAGSTITRAGTIVGTPRYMAPEQRRGEACDERSDQYSFCMALFEALFGELPKVGASPTELSALMLRGAQRVSATLPVRVEQALARGLQVEPDARWPSVEALLAALSPRPARRVGTWVGLMGVGVLGLGALSVSPWSRDTVQACTGAAEQLAGIWDDARRDEVESAMTGVSQPYAARVWTKTSQTLDGYAREWMSVYGGACEATVRGDQPTQQLDLRMGCLRQVAMELRATVDVLAEARSHPGVVLRAHALMRGLPSLTRCSDLEALAAEVEPPPADQVDAVDAARHQLARAGSLRRAGRYPAALEAVTEAEALLEGTVYGPIRTQVAMQRGAAFDQLGDYEASKAAFSSALASATRWRQWETMAEASTDLMLVVGHRLGRPEEGLHYLTTAERGSRSPKHLANVRSNQSILLADLGRLDEAEARLREALSLHEQFPVPDLVTAGRWRGNLSVVLKLQGRLDEALVEARAVLGLWEDALGVEHPQTIKMRANIAAFLSEQGEHDQAVAMLQRVIVQWTDALGPDHEYLLVARNNLAETLVSLGQHARAAEEFGIVLDLNTRARGADHLETAKTQARLASALLALDRVAEAKPMLETAWSRAQRDDAPADLRVNAAFLLARATWGGEAPHADRARARTLAADACTTARDEKLDMLVDEIEHWLESHPHD
ncbi:MAG: serine/threonine-protein kinase [Deltaproteobacteria bacterium]|nr:serine/threonine-protein kinase [Deltaproteobacteria bacterium]